MKEKKENKTATLTIDKSVKNELKTYAATNILKLNKLAELIIADFLKGKKNLV